MKLEMKQEQIEKMNVMRAKMEKEYENRAEAEKEAKEKAEKEKVFIVRQGKALDEAKKRIIAGSDIKTKRNHSGVALAKHQEEAYDEGRGGHDNPDIYCVCGTSGGTPITSTFDTDGNPVILIANCIVVGIDTCGFCTGQDCSNMVFHRKWSCCNQVIIGKREDLLKIPSCE
jgi:hypothetical protein